MYLYVNLKNDYESIVSALKVLIVTLHINLNKRLAVEKKKQKKHTTV